LAPRSWPRVAAPTSRGGNSFIPRCAATGDRTAGITTVTLVLADPPRATRDTLPRQSRCAWRPARAWLLVVARRSTPSLGSSATDRLTARWPRRCRASSSAQLVPTRPSLTGQPARQRHGSSIESVNTLCCAPVSSRFGRSWGRATPATPVSSALWLHAAELRVPDAASEPHGMCSFCAIGAAAWASPAAEHGMPHTRLLLPARDSERGYRQPVWASVVLSRPRASAICSKDATSTQPRSATATVHLVTAVSEAVR
jgi:hypothetical protein